MWLFSTTRYFVLLFCNILFSYRKPVSYLFSNSDKNRVGIQALPDKELAWG